jgi:hypothetical protein
MSDKPTIVNPSSFINISENEFAHLRHVRTELHRDATGFSLVWRFEANGDCDSTHRSSSVEPTPHKEDQSSENEILTTEQVAHDLKMSAKTVRKLITNGTLEALPGVCPYKVTREALNRYVRGHLPRKDPDPSAGNTGNNYVPSRRKARRILTGLKVPSAKPKEEEIKRAVDDMKKWER